MFGVLSTCSSTLEEIPIQLVYERTIILPIQYQSNQKYINKKKQRLIKYGNKRKDKKHILFDYNVNDDNFINMAKRSKHGDREPKELYSILESGKNGTSKIDKVSYSDTVNIRNCHQCYT